jgi:1-acyl-sn-glycerol-3-phosphate acyltransferase
MTGPTWRAAPEPELAAPDARGWVRVIRRGVPVVLLLAAGFLLLLVLRLIERPFFGLYRPVTPWITVGVFRTVLFLLGIGYRRNGAPTRQSGALVANHSSWLDILALNAARPIYFVSKSEVSGWAGIGVMARAVGTVFIERDRRHARAQAALFEWRLTHGHRLLFFPEGTSTDGQHVLPFKTALFSAFFAERIRASLHVQPVTVLYHAPRGARPDFYGWWGGMALAPHLLAVLAAPRQGQVEVLYHPPLRVSDHSDRKALAAACEAAVRAGHRGSRPPLQ